MLEHPASDIINSETENFITGHVVSDSDIVKKKKKRAVFSDAEDNLLVQLVEQKANEGFPVSGNLLYSEILSNFPKRSPQSLRARYLKILRFKSSNPAIMHSQPPSENVTQLKTLSDSRVNPTHLQELVNELHNEPLPEPVTNINPSSCIHADPTDMSSVLSIDQQLINANADHSHINAATDYKAANFEKKHITSLSRAELLALKNLLIQHQNESITEFIQSEVFYVKTQDPIFIWLLYQFSGNILLVLDFLLDPPANIPSFWWTPALDSSLLEGHIPICFPSVSSIPERISWLKL